MAGVRRFNLAAQRFGRLIAVRPVHGTGGWECRCDCGGITEATTTNLRQGRHMSCGCAINQSKRTHGRSKTPEYRIWAGMKNRCENQGDDNYRCYGARGIKVCERWQQFADFFADMGPRPTPKHSIERIDNSGNYEPGNCRWATVYEQSRNARHNRFITFEGVTLCHHRLGDAARRHNNRDPEPHSARAVGRKNSGATLAEQTPPPSQARPRRRRGTACAGRAGVTMSSLRTKTPDTHDRAAIASVAKLALSLRDGPAPKRPHTTRYAHSGCEVGVEGVAAGYVRISPEWLLALLRDQGGAP